MPKQQPTLIMMNMTYHHLWKQGMVNRNFHMLKQMQRSQDFGRIISVDVLPISLMKVGRVALSARPWLKNAQTVVRTRTFRIDVDPVYPQTFYVSAYGTKSLLAAWRYLRVPIKSSIVWSYDPLSFERIQALKPAACIFDAVDNWMEHPSYTHLRERLSSAYQYIGEHADLIFTVSEGLLDLFGRKSNAFFIPNGVDYEHFSSTEHVLKDFASAHERPVIGYHGVIQSRMNFAILEYLVNKHPEYQFRCVGPIWKDAAQEMKRLAKHANVQCLGTVPYVRLPEAIHHFDCAIIPHNIDAFTHSMNPLKLYEYLAAGLPIVSTPIAGADQFQDLVRFAVSPEDFSREIQKALATDSIELRKRRASMASQHTWEQRYSLIARIMHARGIVHTQK